MPNHVDNIVDNTLGAEGWNAPNGNFAKMWRQYVHGAIQLNQLPAELRDVLKKADNGDGALTMREARDFLIQRSIVRQDGEADDFKVALEYAFGQLTGVPVDPATTPHDQRPAHVCYIQLNNADNNPNLQETKDIKMFAGRDPDRPSVDIHNWTREFNTNGDVRKATKAFTDNLKAYMDRVIASGERMTAFILSGHSNGTDMLQETADHRYYGNLDPRAVLRELRQVSKYRKLFDSVEKVAALGCFQGGHVAEWAEIFPKACIAGTRRFSPLADVKAPSASYGPSGAIYDVVSRAHQVLEDGGAIEKAKGEQKRGMYRTFLNNDRKLAMHVPESSGLALQEAKEALQQAEAGFKDSRTLVADIMTANGRGIGQDKLDEAYGTVNQYYGARGDVHIASGRTGGAAEEEIVHKLKVLTGDLFAIRKHQPSMRPPRPARWPENYWRPLVA